MPFSKKPSEIRMPVVENGSLVSKPYNDNCGSKPNIPATTTHGTRIPVAMNNHEKTFIHHGNRDLLRTGLLKERS